MARNPFFDESPRNTVSNLRDGLALLRYVEYQELGGDERACHGQWLILGAMQDAAEALDEQLNGMTISPRLKEVEGGAS